MKNCSGVMTIVLNLFNKLINFIDMRENLLQL